MKRSSRWVLGLVLTAASAACLFPDSDPARGTECDEDRRCPESRVACREPRCVEGRCETVDTPAGITDRSGTLAADCRRFVCDGRGSATPELDVTAIPRRTPPPCKTYQCNNAGVVELINAPSGVQADAFKDCKQTSCDGAGNAVIQPAPTDVPADVPGDCKRPTCTAEGAAVTVTDDSDVPSSGSNFCKAPSCSSGRVVETPRNVGSKCNDMAEACSSSGECNVCFTPDLACTDVGPGAGAHNAATPHDWRGIGRCDDGGRSWCGSVRSGETVHYVYHDNQTGPFCSFDPRIAFHPTDAATVCLLADCPVGPSCPSGWTASSDGKFRGCCTTSGPEGTGNKRIDYCRATAVKIRVTTSKPCVGYRLSFNQ